MSNGLKDLEKIKFQNNWDGMECGNFSFDFNYYNENGDIKTELFSEIAQEIVIKCFDYLIKDKDYFIKDKKKIVKHNKPSSSQIRKFYDSLLNYKNIIENSNCKKTEFQKQLPYIKMMKAKAHVAYERGYINTNFKKFIDKGIDSIKDDIKNFEVFLTFFEAIVAYSKGNLKD